MTNRSAHTTNPLGARVLAIAALILTISTAVTGCMATDRTMGPPETAFPQGNYLVDVQGADGELTGAVVGPVETPPADSAHTFKVADLVGSVAAVAGAFEGIDPDDLLDVDRTDVPEADGSRTTYLSFVQSVDGVPVDGTWVDFIVSQEAGEAHLVAASYRLVDVHTLGVGGDDVAAR